MAKAEHKCDVSGCNEPAERSLPRDKVSAHLSVGGTGHGRVHLCKKHYREYKKKTKEERKLERLGW